jgi:hypothetical protein
MDADNGMPHSDSIYNPDADMAAIKAAHKKSAAKEPETWMSTDQLQELRKVERERIEGAKMKRMGFVAPPFFMLLAELRY